MADLTLGLDLGPTSIGWALIDTTGCEIVATGVRVFPEGVERDKGREVSKNEARRIARGMRRQIRRRAMRRRRLRKLLVELGLLPDVALLDRTDPRRDQWESAAFHRADPFELRDLALRESISLHDFGRVLLHLNQRRGFKSNRRTDRDSAKKKEQSDLLQEISDLGNKLNGRTLGQYLHEQRGNDPARRHLVRVRGLHTRRDMLESEFDRLWDSQQRFHPNELSASRARVRDLIFFQRNLLPPGVGMVGKCELMPRLPRCPRADRRAALFRLYQEVTNLRVIDSANRVERDLSADERTKLIDLLKRKKEYSFDDIRKKLFDQPETITFNLERGGRKKLRGLPADAFLLGKSGLGKTWAKVPEDLKNRIVAALIEDEEGKLRFLLKEAGFDSELATGLLDRFDPEAGYSSYSLSAIKRLLPHMERGLPLSSRDATVPSALRTAGFVMPWERSRDTQPSLPEPPMIANPIVRQALVEVRKVVNTILRDLVRKQGHRLTSIHVELAREAKGTAELRAKRSREMQDRAAARDEAANRLRELGYKVSKDGIDRYLLWKEQGEICVYSGRPISISQLLGGEIDIDHILPYSRSLDDSMMNKVLCFRSENTAGPDRIGKGERTPVEWLAASNPQKYEQMLLRVHSLPYSKKRRFFQQSLDIEDFFARQFVDTTYIATQVVEFVRCLGADVLPVHGGHTAELRRHWGLNTVLRIDDADIKNREDHRHHAVDAIVIALTTRARLHQLAQLRRAGGFEATGEVLNEPWAGFRTSVEKSVNSIVVSHRAQRHIRGALHDEKPFGATETPGVFVKRKPLSELSAAEVHNIRDDTIRQTVSARLAEHGINPARGAGKIPDEVWKIPVLMDSGIPIKKVRVKVNDKAIRAIRGGSIFVAPGSTHHIALFERRDSNGRQMRYMRALSMLEAMQRKRRDEPLISRVDPDYPDAKFIFSLAMSEMILLKTGEKSDVYRFETAASTSGQMWFRHHTFAGKSSDKRMQISKRPNTLDARKIVVDVLGRVRWAKD